jgi:hypothetical protein
MGRLVFWRTDRGDSLIHQRGALARHEAVIGKNLTGPRLLGRLRSINSGAHKAGNDIW